MPVQQIRFYQTGSFAAGNRLLDPDRRSVQSDAERANSVSSGHRACQGCGEALGARYALDAAMRATNGQLVAVNATGCLEVFSTPFPQTSWRIPWIHSLYNEAYMNTGVQRSGATPPAARTATTPVVGESPGNAFGQGKSAPLIAMAHEIGYVATATVAGLRDLEYKVRRAMEFRGARYLHVLVPCPLGWGSASCDTIKIARLAEQTGLFPVFEAEYGEVVSVSKIRRQAPVEEYLKLQRRYAHLFGSPEGASTIARLQARADRNIARFGLLDDEPASQDGEAAP